MLFSLFFVFTFLVCWVFMMVNRIRAMKVQKKLSYRLKLEYPKMRNELDFSNLNFNISEFKHRGLMFLKMIVSFGSQNRTMNFMDCFVDIKAVNETNDESLISLTNSTIQLTREFVKVFLIAVLVFVFGWATWKVN